MKPIGVVLISALFLGCLACSQDSSKSSGPTLEPHSGNQDSVGSDIAALEHSPNEWLRTYTSGGKTAKFIIQLGPARAINEKDFPMSSGNGRFLSQSGSEPIVLIADLAKALQAKQVPINVPRAKTVPFDYVILGQHQSRSGDGGFGDSPHGNWTAMKIFLGKGESEGEVFLNFNSALGKAEFSIKDSDYGDFVIAELAKVL
jgi:hypothetical protein